VQEWVVQRKRTLVAFVAVLLMVPLGLLLV
jgi:hypothetical protein